MNIRPIDADTRPQVDESIRHEWNGPIIVSRDIVLDTSDLPGFVWVENGAVLGAVTLHVADGDCEVATLVSYAENRGIATALLDAATAFARQQGCRRLFLITTNDNIHAIGFYQKRGFDLVAVGLDAVERARRRKPSIPLTGDNGIPIKHEFEFEFLL